MIPPFFLIPAFAWLDWLFGVPAPAVSPASAQDAQQLAALHAAAFRRGWSAEEFERLLIERSVVADRAMSGSRLAGFVISRLAADQAEILSIAVALPHRGRGLGRTLLDVHMRRLAAYGTSALFLEVDESNVPARRLYAGLGFNQVGRRERYYANSQGDGAVAAAPAGANAGAALVLRRDLT
jgi:[ribosomal protein S18]-alanine N-acetyltransferase